MSTLYLIFSSTIILLSHTLHGTSIWLSQSLNPLFSPHIVLQLILTFDSYIHHNHDTSDLLLLPSTSFETFTIGRALSQYSYKTTEHFTILLLILLSHLTYFTKTDEAQFFRHDYQKLVNCLDVYSSHLESFVPR